MATLQIARNVALVVLSLCDYRKSACLAADLTAKRDSVPLPITKADQDEYRIGAGDILQLIVWKEPEASVPSTVVRPDGRIALPLLKEVKVAGLTPREAEKEITAQLSDFIRSADVTVIVSAINSKKAYVLGAVKREGPVPLQYNMSLLQVLSEAGGVTEYAKKKKIYLLRMVSGREVRFPFNYESVIKGISTAENIQVLANDTIVVPQ